ncbi:IclR family transcriptional regulator [Actinomadura barringtoniae]|uniref:Glycerol operon regulatory protein n=1 Tax=Actinomadura barringtoniae TaxID=1427535 RepID=A0A939PK79_9ACTN|nr:IclR family transcriptional regulator [Actinomadura barringtoniae]MBO2450091.1 IclR family transcriptional regulator [Actinomadura barringtoniae]
MGNSPRPEGTVQSVDRAVTVLEILAREGEAGVTQIAAELGVHKSTAFRLVSALENRDLVAQDSERGKYRLGLGLVRLAGATTARLDVVRVGRPLCRDLAAEIGETVNLTLLSGHEVLYVDQVAGPSALQPKDWVGQRLPTHATSNGKVLLAHLPGDRLDEELSRPLERLTAHTLTERGALEDDLRRVRERGYATAVDELEFGLTAIAAPIRDADGQVIATVSGSGPSFRLPPERIPAVAGVVRRAADEISRRLGWNGS